MTQIFCAQKRRGEESGQTVLAAGRKKMGIKEEKERGRGVVGGVVKKWRGQR